ELQLLGFFKSNGVTKKTLQKIKPDGTLGDSFTDFAKTIKASPASYGMAVAHDGTTYIVNGSFTTTARLFYPGSSVMDSVSEALPAGSISAGIGPNMQTSGGVPTYVALSPDDSTLYYPQAVAESGSSAAVGAKVIGVSLADGSTKAVYGGGTTSCSIRGGSLR